MESELKGDIKTLEAELKGILKHYRSVVVGFILALALGAVKLFFPGFSG